MNWQLLVGFFGSILLLQEIEAQSCGGGSIQLVGGTQGREGRLEVCYNGQWGTVCDDYFGNVDARVACRHVGYPSDGAVAFKNAYFGKGSGNIWLDNLYCTGNEGNIFSCPRAGAVGSHNCDHSEDAGIRCPPCVEGNVVFIRGSSKQGVPMICHDGSYGTICDDGFDVNDAKVICRMLGYPTEGVQAFNGSTRFKIGYGEIFATQLGCTGSEGRITDCPGQFYTSNTCTHAQDAGVICPSCDDWLGVQLWSAYPDTPKSQGMLQICESNGQWRGVCSKGSWCPDAKVACRDLGFKGSNHITISKNVDLVYGYIRQINPFQYNCVGDEDHFSDCPRKYDSTCDNPQWETVGISCADVPGEYNCTAGDIRFRKGTELSTAEGRVEYCFENHWSPFCWLNDEQATVICKQKGYTEYSWASIYFDERYGTSGLVTDFQRFVCSQDAKENSVDECTKKLRNSCTVQECPTEFGMQCFSPGMCDEGTYRLVGGDIEQEGRIELCLNGVWGTFCDSNWGSIDAYVFCRQMGYDGSIAPVAYKDSQFGDGIYPIVWGVIQCKGWEETIADCPRKDYLNFYCTRTDVASVLCAEDCADGDVRLVGGKDELEGTVEVCFAGLWGVIDTAGWDDNEAEVVCRQLGFQADGAQAILGSAYGRPNKTIHLTAVGCVGTENTIEDCSKKVIALTEGKTAYKNNDVASVDCVPEPPTPPPCIVKDVPKSGSECPNEGQLRLVDGTSNDVMMEGRLEYCFNGLWTGFCTLNEAAATVACKNLGYIANSKASIITSGQFGSPKNYSIVQNVTCTSISASSFDQCTVLQAGDCIPNCPNSNLGLRCFADGQCNYGDIRLAGGYIEQEGRVEVCVDNVWGVICDEGWGETDAHIACQQLGHPELEPIVFTGSYFGDGIYPVVYSNMQCIGPEDTLLQCQKQEYLAFSCPRNQIAGVLCGYDCQNGDVRLVGGPKNTIGTVEVCFDNLWGLVADSGWDEKDAATVCGILGHSRDYAKAYLGSQFGKPNKTLQLSNVQCGGDEVEIDQCAFDFYSLAEGKQLIADVQVAGVECLPNGCIPSSVSGTSCTTGDVRLDGGQSVEEGNLQYCINGTWSPFCGVDFLQASVACRQLGHPNNDYASVFDDARFNPATNTSYFQNFNCSMDSPNFANCTLNDLCISQCTNTSAIRCYSPGGCDEGSTRLMNGYLEQEGRLEICINGVWSSICDNNFDQSDGLSACKSLGYEVAEPAVYYGSMFGDGDGPIVYANMQCEGYERDLRYCNKDEYPMSMCSRNNVVGVLCKDGCTEGDVKLVLGGSDNEGTVVICKDSMWSMISDAGWDTLEAQVTCLSLGYVTEGAVIRSNSYYGKVNKTIGYYNFGCTGSESSLYDCSNQEYTYDQGKLYAMNMTVAGVYCMPPDPTEPPTVCPVTPTQPPSPACKNGDVQLASGATPEEGRLMYCYNTQWSPFCSVDSNTASVACKTLGYSVSSAAIFTDGRYGNSPLNYSLFVSLTCQGNENAMIDCPRVSTGCVPVCTNNVGIRCYNPTDCEEGAIRLSGGDIQQQGRVEVCKSGIWSTICATGWDNTNAYVVCQQVGYASQASVAFADNLFGNGKGPIVFSDVQCVGHETNIADCPRKVYPDSSCSAGVAAGVMCSDDCKDGDIKLVGSTNSYEGTVEVCFDNLWGLISHSGWTTKDAEVVCAQLGLKTNEPRAIPNSRFGKPSKTFHLSNVNCYGAETSITDCGAYKIPLNDGDGYEAAGVICVPIPYTSTSTVPAPTTEEIVQEDDTSNVASLYLMAGIFGVFAVLAILSVVGLFVLMLVVYQRRKEGTDMMSAEKKINKRESKALDGAMPLYAVVNRNRDSMVSFSANDGAVDLDY